MAASTSPQRKVELLRLGESLLHGSGDKLSRSEWSQVVEALLPGGKAAPRESARQLIEALPDSWLKGRSRGAPERIRQLRATFREMMTHRLSDLELRFLVGWMDRMLRIRDETRRQEARASNGFGHQGSPSRGGRR